MKKFSVKILRNNLIALFVLSGLGSILGAVPAIAATGVGNGDLTSGRLESILALIVGLVSVVIGGLSLRPLAHAGFKKYGAVVAVIGGLVSIVLSMLHLVRSYGAALGTGSGKLGAIAALMVGLIGLILGWLALIRRTGSPAGQ